MKTVKNLVKTAMMVLFVVMSACSAEDGVDGQDGAVGPQGPAGVDGQDGMDGEDGNANVQSLAYDISAASGTVYSQAIPELTADVLENDLVYAFVHAGTLTYPIPNTVNPGGTQFFIRVFYQSGSLDMRFNLATDNSTYDMPAGTLEQLRVVIVQSTSGRSSQQTHNDLLNAGVDVTNYESLKAHFDLN